MSSARRAVVALVLALVALLAGCTSPTTEGQARTAITDGLEQASSAVATATLTVELLDGGRLTSPVADTSLLDQLGALDEASTALTTLVVPADLATQRETGMTAVGMANDAVVAARAWVSGERGEAIPATAAEVLDALESAQGQLEDALAEVEA